MCAPSGHAPHEILTEFHAKQAYIGRYLGQHLIWGQPSGGDSPDWLARVSTGTRSAQKEPPITLGGSRPPGPSCRHFPGGAAPRSRIPSQDFTGLPGQGGTCGPPRHLFGPGASPPTWAAQLGYYARPAMHLSILQAQAHTRIKRRADRKQPSPGKQILGHHLAAFVYRTACAEVYHQELISHTYFRSDAGWAFLGPGGYGIQTIY